MSLQSASIYAFRILPRILPHYLKAAATQYNRRALLNTANGLSLILQRGVLSKDAIISPCHTAYRHKFDVGSPATVISRYNASSSEALFLTLQTYPTIKDVYLVNQYVSDPRKKTSGPKFVDINEYIELLRKNFLLPPTAEISLDKDCQTSIRIFLFGREVMLHLVNGSFEPRQSLGLGESSTLELLDSTCLANSPRLFKDEILGAIASDLKAGEFVIVQHTDLPIDLVKKHGFEIVVLPTTVICTHPFSPSDLDWINTGDYMHWCIMRKK